MISSGSRDINLPLTQLGQQLMSPRTESMSELGKDWRQQPTSVSAQLSSLAAHSGLVSTSQCLVHEQLMHEQPVNNNIIDIPIPVM